MSACDEPEDDSYTDIVARIEGKIQAYNLKPKEGERYCDVCAVRVNGGCKAALVLGLRCMELCASCLKSVKKAVAAL